MGPRERAAWNEAFAQIVLANNGICMVLSDVVTNSHPLQMPGELTSRLETARAELNEVIRLMRQVMPRTPQQEAADCTCYHTCMENPKTGCSMSGNWHQHESDPCHVHPTARMSG